MSPKAVRYVVAGVAAFVALAPEALLACPVCFGTLDGPLADGANKAVLALLVFYDFRPGGVRDVFHLSRETRSDF